jgi:alpha-L-fucosidase
MSPTRRILEIAVLGIAAACAGQTPPPTPTSPPQTPQAPAETPAQRDTRMVWWREARFGMFIHWGLYAIPAGESGGRKDHGEWVRHTGQIPVEEYDKLVAQFNPVKFNADEWVRIAKDAGMQYIVITSKHHDGFCLFDSQFTDYDVMSTPFKRDILKELSAACSRAGIRLCFYHSIMDWHHPDYLPRREWEKRAAEGANFDRYVQHMKNQLRELLTNYGRIGVLWFDGEWENTWTHERGVDLYSYVRGLDPEIIINNRVDVMREGMAGMSRDSRAVGDFGTPEQEIPATGMPGVDWETCMTMNDHWGYNQVDKNFKSTEQLIHMLADIASKGGNFLLNVGPTAEGEIPPESIERLTAIGRWMKVNGESIRGTSASPFKALPWGRCTQRPLDGGLTRLYLHVFDWPRNGRLAVGGLLNDAKRAELLRAGTAQPLDVRHDGDALVVSIPPSPPDPIDTVIALDIVGKPDVGEPPIIRADADIFVDSLDVVLRSEQSGVEIRYTTDGSEPGPTSPVSSGPVRLSATTTLKARAFRGGRPVSDVSQAAFTQVAPRPAEKTIGGDAGLRFEYFEGEWDRLPDFDQLTPVARGGVEDFDFSPRKQAERFAFRFRGHVVAPRAGVYRFFTSSDDGSRLYIGDQLVVDNDGLHGTAEKSGVIALDAGAHPITVTFFERTGGDGLEVSWSGPRIDKQRIPKANLFR